MSDIQPALSAEEWVSQSTSGVDAQEVLEPGWTHITTGKVYVNPHEGEQVELTRRHAVAALCLHNQPYGFTNDEALALQRLLNAAIITSEIERYGIPEVRTRAESAIAKIKALLPPVSP